MLWCAVGTQSMMDAAFVSLKAKFDSQVFFLYAKCQSCVVMAHQIKKLNLVRNCSYSLANYLETSYESGEVNRIVWILLNIIHKLSLLLAMSCSGWCDLCYQTSSLLYVWYDVYCNAPEIWVFVTSHTRRSGQCIHTSCKHSDIGTPQKKEFYLCAANTPVAARAWVATLESKVTQLLFLAP
jgi:uncharacterized protein YlbG (UPF0298 family)